HEEEALEDRGRRALEGVLLLDVEELAAHLEALVQRARLGVRARREARLEVLQQDRVELRHAFRGLVVALHHRFARAPRRRVLEAELGGEGALQVEHQPVLAPAGEVVQADAQVLQMRLEPGELPRLVALDEPVADEVAPARAQIRIDARGARDPLDRLQVAQAARRFLQVRLERVGRVLVLGVALLLLELLRLEERHRIGRRIERFPEAAEELLASHEETRFEERGADGDVAGSGLDAALDGAHAVADLEADVPEAADQALERLALRGARLLREQDEEVDVRAREELAAAVAAGRDERGLARHAGLAPDGLDGAVNELS